ncbi:ankyrin repeat-containing domain protein [Coprinopsis sp. MPI-PUGE-AT-0042]|nr:ankyrin repeat-containing domain protein [Coprinopsis sp. MPI-PUGE-AT-0042]
MLALENKHDALAAQLLQRADIDIRMRVWYGWTPLMIACLHGLRESARLLLEKDPSVINLQRDGYGRTALMHAAQNGHQDIVESLLRHPDIRVDVKDLRSRTAAQLSATPEIQQLIEAHEATQRP